MLDAVNRRRDEELQLIKMIHSVRADHPTMGCRDMYHMLNPEFMGRDAFERFCKDNKLLSRRTTNYRKTTNSNGVKRFSNLMEGLKINAINKVWTSDITYYELGDRFYYLTFILDAYSNRIVGHSVSKRLNTEDTTLSALQMAIKTRSYTDLTGLIFHSDGGGQYYDKAFLKLTESHGIKNSMCIYPWENGKAERINGVIKNNYLKHRVINNFEDLIREVDHAVYMYNYAKPHIRLNRVAPVVYEEKILSLQ